MCDCELCQFGRKLQELVDKYKMSDEDKKFMLNDVFMKAEYLIYEQEHPRRRGQKGEEDVITGRKIN